MDLGIRRIKVNYHLQFVCGKMLCEAIFFQLVHAIHSEYFSFFNFST